MDAQPPHYGGAASWGERYFRLAMDVAQNYKPLDQHEQQALMARSAGMEPIFHLGNDL